MEDDRTDEDRIIEALVVEGKNALYEDIDFLPLRQSLYNVENVVPVYDDEVSQSIEWCRPSKIWSDPVYFNPSSNQLAVQVGSLPDQTFLGTLMAICAYSKYDLIENIFASRPEDFTKYGIYTCRFYVDGEWVEVITDTHIPCVKNNITGKYLPAYGTSDNPNEMWVAFVEKAFAKAMGSYEEIPNIKVQKALLHLTGGSVQAVNLKDEVQRHDSVTENEAWCTFKKKLENDSIVLLLPNERKVDPGESSPNDETPAPSDNNLVPGSGKDRLPGEEFFIPDMMYSAVMCKDIGGYELVLMHNPWKVEGYEWTGEWSDSSNDWDLYPELLTELERDPSVPWTRRRPNGYFFISFRNLVKFFNRTYYCKLFPSEKFNFYCARGECRGRHAGGPLVPLRDKTLVLQEAAASRSKAAAKATAAVVVDGDASWFNNPQYRIHCTAPGTTQVYVSVVPLGSADEGVVEQTQNVNITVTCSPKSANVQAPLWEVSSFDVLASDRTEPGILRVKGMESSLWSLEMDSKHFYHVVPNTVRRELESDYILRVFSTKPIVLESVNPIPQYVLSGEWRRVGDMDSTGGALKVQHSDGTLRDNPKWCQNPQYHVEIADPFGKDELYLKVVLKRTDHRTGTGHKSGHRGTNAHDHAHDQKKLDAHVGLVICKADQLDEGGPKHKKKPPKQNVMGELLPTKVSTLKKAPTSEAEELMRNMELSQPKTILRKLSIDPSAYHLATPFCSKTESCVFFPKIPRAWVPNGLLIVPCLNERNVKGSFDLEVYASEKIYLNALPETYSRSIAGDWVENACGGNHLNPNTWKKNPKFTLKFHYPVHTEEFSRVRITLARVGTNWKSLAKRDTVGCMIGFYIFINHGTELRPFYESTFVPDNELSTETTFTMPQLGHGETFTIMPTTFGEGKLGSFVISILAEYEFAITKEKST